MKIEVRDPRFLEIVDQDAELEVLAENLEFTEGPIWHPIHQHLTFSDIPADRMYRWHGRDRKLEVFREPSHNANGNTYDRSGRILTCEHATSRVTRAELDGSTTILASHHGDKELNSPNDIVVGKNDYIYFTDPLYGRFDRHGVERQQELDFQGVYLYRPASEELVLLADDFEAPNGLCLSPDESMLYVNDTTRRHVRRFQVETDGSLSGGDVFAVSEGTGAGVPDGMKVDSQGNLFCAGPGGVHVYDPQDGRTLGVIQTSEFCANFTWGGEDLRTLFLTASTCLLRTRTLIPGTALF